MSSAEPFGRLDECDGATVALGGYAFAQEDHDSRSKGTFVQRRSLIRMFDTKKKKTPKIGTPI